MLDIYRQRRREHPNVDRSAMIEIVPSVLPADFPNLERQLRPILDLEVSRLHIDVMDGHFVPNLSMGPRIVRCLKPLADEYRVDLDVHLMVTDQGRHIEAFVEAGATIVTVHIEPHPHLARLVALVRELGVRVGVALNPATPVLMLQEIVSQIDQILILTVSPGFSGQRFQRWAAEKIADTRRLLLSHRMSHVAIEVDGGINHATIGDVVQAGADFAVLGSALFSQPNRVAENLRGRRRQI